MVIVQVKLEKGKNNHRQTQKMVVQPKAWEDVVSLTPCLTCFPVTISVTKCRLYQVISVRANIRELSVEMRARALLSRNIGVFEAN